MKELKCKLIVSDFDGTLANSKNEVEERVVNAINGYVENGGIFAVCSGRILPSILPRVKQLGLSGLVVACQGGVIADIKTGELIRNSGFTPKQSAEICAVLEQLKTNVQLYSNQGFFSDLPEDEKHLNIYESIIGVKAEHAPCPLSEYALVSPQKFLKVATLCHPAEQEELFKKLQARLGDKYDVTCSAAVLIEISPRGDTKGSALKFLCERYGVPIQNACAVGDNLNDMSMISAAGYGVAVGNACEGLKRAAKYVTVSNDDGAVAEVIKKFGYGE